MPYQLQACRAHELAQKLDHEELFVLMACEGLGKSRQLRVFPRAALRKPSVDGWLRQRNVTLDQVVKALLRKGFLNPVGRGKLVCTDDGDLVKHAFNDLKNDLVLHRTDEPLSGNPFDWINVLRREMEAACAAEALRDDAEALR